MAYSEDFRRAAVRQASRPGSTVAGVARDLSVSPTTLRRWMKTIPVEPPTAVGAPAAPSGPDVDAEIEPAALSEDPAPEEPAPEEPTPEGSDEPPAGDAAVDTETGAAALARRLRSRSLNPARLDDRLGYVLITLAWVASVLLSAVLSPGPDLADTAVAVHLLSLVVAFGAVVLVDWHGLLWALGRRDLRESTRVAEAASPLIWTGLAGLLASGALLSPDLTSPLSWLKLGCVLLVSLNGFALTSLSHELASLPAQQTLRSLTSRVRFLMVRAALVSQVGWWTAIAVGMRTALGR